MSAQPLPTAAEIRAAVKEMPYEDWLATARRRFGWDPKKWRFVCPSCGHVQTLEDFLPFMDEELARTRVGFSCIGRYDGVHGNVPMLTEPGPCNYASGGLFCINDLWVVFEDGSKMPVFEFEEAQ